MSSHLSMFAVKMFPYKIIGRNVKAKLCCHLKWHLICIWLVCVCKLGPSDWSSSAPLYILVWNDFAITFFREFLNGICFNTRCISSYWGYISNLRPLKAKLSLLRAFGVFWQFLAIFAFLAELGNSKHFEPYLFFWPFRPFLALRPLWPSKAKNSGLLRHN